VNIFYCNIVFISSVRKNLNSELTTESLHCAHDRLSIYAYDHNNVVTAQFLTMSMLFPQ